MQQNFQIVIQQVSYALPNGTFIFNDLNIALTKEKIGLVGRNGVGKSTLFKLITGELLPHAGALQVMGKLAYAPQNPNIPFTETVAGVLGFAEKIAAFRRISAGSIDEKDFTILNDEWTVEERLKEQLKLFALDGFPFDRLIGQLSGGELTRLLLTKAFFSGADILLLDEPTNHLDAMARKILYQAIENWRGGLIVISHDRALLNKMTQIAELSSLGIQVYGGNYEAYAAQKNIETLAKEKELQDAKKLLRVAQYSMQDSHEKHEQKQKYGREKRSKQRIDKLLSNSAVERSERTQRTLLIRNERMIKDADERLKNAREKIELIEEIDLDLPATRVPNGKMVLELESVTFSYPGKMPIINNVDLKIQGPEHIALIGDNGSGKTTLIKLILAELIPTQGKIVLGTPYVSYLDQDTCLLQKEASILENFLRMNPDAKEHDAYQALAHFLFKNTTALKQVKDLSGGEKLRALLACILMAKNPPQLLILDEPTNHLDLHSIQQIESALKNYEGAMIVVSHDQEFLTNVGIEKIIYAPF